MKELNPIRKDEVKLHGERQVEKKTVFLGSDTLMPNHRCFELNLETMECIEAQYERECHFNDPDTRKVVIKPRCLYINAMNKKNAMKVYKNGGRALSIPFLKLGEY